MDNPTDPKNLADFARCLEEASQANRMTPEASAVANNVVFIYGTPDENDGPNVSAIGSLCILLQNAQKAAVAIAEDFGKYPEWDDVTEQFSDLALSLNLSDIAASVTLTDIQTGGPSW